jgi:hypothetical protein
VCENPKGWHIGSRPVAGTSRLTTAWRARPLQQRVPHVQRGSLAAPVD